MTKEKEKLSEVKKVNKTFDKEGLDENKEAFKQSEHTKIIKEGRDH